MRLAVETRVFRSWDQKRAYRLLLVQMTCKVLLLFSLPQLIAHFHFSEMIWHEYHSCYYRLPERCLLYNIKGLSACALFCHLEKLQWKFACCFSYVKVDMAFQFQKLCTEFLIRHLLIRHGTNYKLYIHLILLMRNAFIICC